MTNIYFLVFRIFFITIMTLGMMTSLTEFRFGRRKLWMILAAYSGWVIISSLALLWFGGELLLLRVFFFTISIPATCLVYWAAEDGPSQAVFNYMSQILLSMLLISTIRLITVSFGFSGLVNILLMGIAYGAIIYLEYRFLRKPFRKRIKVIPTRWSVLTLIPCVFCIYFIFIASWPDTYLHNRQQRVYIYATVLPMIVVYISVFKSLIGQYHAQMERHSAELLQVQISALKEKLQKVDEVEYGVRVQRHDLRHRLQIVTELVTRGDRESALEFLELAQKRLDDHRVSHWCRPPVLDAVFSSYFDQAKALGIQVEAKISLPDALPVDEGELAIVLANALENAIHANLELPPEGRTIRCKMVGTPGIMLKISNPCTGEVSFNSDGLPVAQEEGHGLGIQSISTFCQKNGAVCQFELIDQWFSFRLIL